MPEASSPTTQYEIAFCDLDGTIAMYDHGIRPAVVEAMRDVIACGRWITVCTGRGYQTARPFLEQVPVNAPLVLCNGGLIVEAGTRRVLEFHPMPLPLVHRLMRLALHEGLEMWVYLDDMESRAQHKPPAAHFTLDRPGIALQEVPDPFRLVSRPPHKVIFEAESPAATPRLIETVENCLDGAARVVTSSPEFVEVIMPGVSKAKGMARVARLLGVKRARTLAVGDGDNDVEMIAWAGRGVAMGNATPAAVRAAQWVAPSVDQDGLAVALRKFMIPKIPAG